MRRLSYPLIVAAAVSGLLVAACGSSKCAASKDSGEQAPATSGERAAKAPGALATRAPAGLAGTLLPPKGHGVAASRLAGCLVEGERSEADGGRFPAPGATRDGAPDVRLATTPAGLMVTHEASHACCLQAKVETLVEGQSVVVRETYSGTPCRCRCGSTVRASVGLRPGDYTLTLERVEAGETTRSNPQAFTITAPGEAK